MASDMINLEIQVDFLPLCTLEFQVEDCNIWNCVAGFILL